SADRTGEIFWLYFCVGHLDVTGDLDFPPIDGEYELRGSVDPCFRDVHDSEIRAIQSEFSVWQGVMPLQVAVGLRGARANSRGALKVEAIVGQPGLEGELPQAEIDLIKIDFTIENPHHTIQQPRTQCPNHL